MTEEQKNEILEEAKKLEMLLAEACDNLRRAVELFPPKHQLSCWERLAVTCRKNAATAAVNIILSSIPQINN